MAESNLQEPTPIAPHDIWTANQRIRPIVRSTPLIPSRVLSDSDTNVFLKLDFLQDSGSFKLRGATNKLLSLTDSERRRGVTTFSTGNHGLAVAHIARKLGIRAVVCVSNGVPKNKVDALLELGAEVERVGESQDAAGRYSYKLQTEQGLTVIPPFDDKQVIAGQGTLGLELLAENPAIDTVVVPLSGGGLMSGVALAVKTINPKIRVIGVTMDRGAAMYESLRAGKPVDVHEVETLADSLRGGIGLNNQYTFDLVRRLTDDIELVSEAEIAQAMEFLFRHHKVVVEGAAATPVSVILRRQIQLGNNVACLITGNNVDTTVFQNVLQH